jgi:hypothetical protein
VLVADDRSVIGRFNLRDIENGSAVLGYRIERQVARRGVATATVHQLCRDAATTFGLRVIRAATPTRTSPPSESWPEPAPSWSVPPTPVSSAGSRAAGRSAGVDGRSAGRCTLALFEQVFEQLVRERTPS